MKVAVRMYIHGIEQSCERLNLDPQALDRKLRELAEQHAHLLTKQPGMVEIEFLDEADKNKRFFRVGTDPSGMVLPMKLDLKKP